MQLVIEEVSDRVPVDLQEVQASLDHHSFSISVVDLGKRIGHPAELGAKVPFVVKGIGSKVTVSGFHKASSTDV